MGNKYIILDNLWRISIRFNLYLLSALVLKLLTKPVSNIKNKNLLVLSKPIFNSDIKSIDSVSNEIGFINFPRLFLNNILIKYCDFYEKLTEENYHSLINETPCQKNMRFHIEKILKYYNKFVKYDGVISGNYVYLNQQELFYVYYQMKVPVYILYKEGLAPVGSFTQTIKDRLYSGKKFIGSNIFFYNSFTKNILLESNIEGINNLNSHTVGVPRLDNIFKNIEIENTKGKKDLDKTIVLFGYYPKQKALRFCNNNSNLISFENHLGDSMNKIINFVKKNNEWKLIIKFKSDKKSKDYLLHLKENIIGKNIKNIIFTDEESINLIKKSGYVFGFASTVLLEALAFKKKILIPCVNNFSNREISDYFYPYDDLARYLLEDDVINEEFFNAIEVTSKYEHQSSEILNKYFYKIDGEASKRVYNKLIKLLA